MLHYNPQHVSSSTLLIFRRTNCIITASGIVTLCKHTVQYAGWERTAVRYVLTYFSLLNTSMNIAERGRNMLQVYDKSYYNVSNYSAVVGKYMVEKIIIIKY